MKNTMKLNFIFINTSGGKAFVEEFNFLFGNNILSLFLTLLSCYSYTECEKWKRFFLEDDAEKSLYYILNFFNKFCSVDKVSVQT